MEPYIKKIKVTGLDSDYRVAQLKSLIETLKGVERVDVNREKGAVRIIAAKPIEAAVLNEMVSSHGFTINEGENKNEHCELTTRPSFWQLLGLFLLVIVLGMVFSRTGLLKPSIAVGSSVGFGVAFLIGLLAASSSCIAVSGGLLLGAAAKFRERFSEAGPIRRMQPVFMFVLGRLASYAILGGVIGAIGKALTPSSFVTGLISIAAALVMIVMGLDMLHLAPKWLKQIMPRLPKSLAHRVMDAEGHPHPFAPFFLGAGTFFLPCGFTQALQLYALTTGSALSGGLVLLGFALGTAPALLALGFASTSLKGKFGQFFFRFSGALVIVMGLWNIQNGFTVVGYPLSLPNFSFVQARTATDAAVSIDPNVKLINGTQVVNIDVSNYGYNPNQFTLARNVPVRFDIGGSEAGQGCLSGFQIPKLKIRQQLTPNQVTSIAFTPTDSGSYIFSCSMGMYRGTFTVL